MHINYSNEKLAKKFMLNITNALNTTIQVLKPSCKNLEVNVIFVRRFVIKKINAETRNVNKVTDVLSYPTLLNENNGSIEKKITKKNFPFDINPQTGNIMLGDVVICVSKCKQQAKKYKNSITREICYLSTHGLLHLFGYDHIESEDKALMRAKEELVMNEMGLTR